MREREREREEEEDELALGDGIKPERDTRASEEIKDEEEWRNERTVVGETDADPAEGSVG